MATRTRAGGIGIQNYLIEAGRVLSALSKQSPKEIIASTMIAEGNRLKDFLGAVVDKASKILDVDVAANIVSEHSYSEPPLASLQTKLRPHDDYFKEVFTRRGSKELREHPGFHWGLVLPERGQFAAIELEGVVLAPRVQDKRAILELSFEVNYDDTIFAFQWLLREWRRPIGQMLRALPNAVLRGNGTTIDGPEHQRSKDPVFLLEHHFAQPTGPGGAAKTFSLRSSFTSDDTDQSVINTCAVFLSLFDSIVRLTAGRVDPDRLLKYYLALLPHIPKATFRSTTIFPHDRS